MLVMWFYSDSIKKYFATELLNFAKRDLEMQQEVDAPRKMLSLMNWLNSCHYQVLLHPSWIKLPLCDLLSVT